jgi:hypothetical protein
MMSKMVKIQPRPDGLVLELARRPVLFKLHDEGSTRLALQRMFDWIEQSGEDERIVERADSRRRILEAVARELDRKPEAPALPLKRAGGRRRK